VREVFRAYGFGPGFVVVIRKGFVELGFREFNNVVQSDLDGFKKP